MVEYLREKIKKLLSKSKLILNIMYHLRVGEILFYFSALHWHLTHSKPRELSMEDVYRLFYLDFLDVGEENCEIIELTENKLVTRCRNPCPILEYAIQLGRDTREVCKYLSEGPCKYFLRKLDKRLVFKRNYDHIRPHKNSCEETIIRNT